MIYPHGHPLLFFYFLCFGLLLSVLAYGFVMVTRKNTIKEEFSSSCQDKSCDLLNDDDEAETENCT
jgi:hypothetical protein